MIRTYPTLPLGVVTLLLAALYHFFLGPRWLQRIPRGWQYEMAYVGIQTNAVPGTDALPTKDVLSEYRRVIQPLSEAGRPDSVIIEDRHLLTEIGTGAVQYDFRSTHVVDPRTGTHVHHPAEIFVFPHHTQRRTYRFRASYLKGIPMGFVREEETEGLTTYVFGYNGRGEYTEFYEGVVDGRQVDIPDSLEVRCANDAFRYRVWVEPVTGLTVRTEESCLSGDYLYDRASGRRFEVVDRFAGSTAGQDVVALVNRARIDRLRIIALTRAIPLALVSLGALLLVRGIWSLRRAAA